MSTFDESIRALFGERVRRQVPLAPLTTFKVGGAADWLVEVNRAEELSALIQLAARHSVPVTCLGGGSNVLVADRGITGVLVRVHGGDVHRVDATTIRSGAGVTINGLVRWTIGQ